MYLNAGILVDIGLFWSWCYLRSEIPHPTMYCTVLYRAVHTVHLFIQEATEIY